MPAELRGVEREKHLGQMWQALSDAEKDQWRFKPAVLPATAAATNTAAASPEAALADSCIVLAELDTGGSESAEHVTAELDLDPLPMPPPVRASGRARVRARVRVRGG